MKKKRLLSFIISMLLLMVPMAVAFADSTKTFDLNSKIIPGANLTGYTDFTKKFIVPNTVKGSAYIYGPGTYNVTGDKSAKIYIVGMTGSATYLLNSGLKSVKIDTGFMTRKIKVIYSIAGESYTYNQEC